MNEVRELHGVTDEEDRRVVANLCNVAAQGRTIIGSGSKKEAVALKQLGKHHVPVA